jgi:hypothetical protein
LNRDALANLGVANRGMPPGYGAIPTLYLVKADGTVVWSDDSARYRHQDATTFTANLKRALDTYLTVNRATKP